MKQKINLTLIFLLLAASLGLILRFAQSGFSFHDYKNTLHTHSHIALLGWLYNACFIVIQYLIFKKENKVFNRLFWFTQLTFFGMLFSFPFEGYGPFSISFSTLYLFSSYFLVYQIYKETKQKNKPYSSKFIRWGGVYLILSSLGPFALAPLMISELAHSFWYHLSIYWFLHFLFNGFFVSVVFAYLFERFEMKKNAKSIYYLMNFSVIPLFALSTLWLKPDLSLYLLSFIAASMQLFAFVLLAKNLPFLSSMNKKWSGLIFLLPLIAYSLKVLFQLIASFSQVQDFINATIPFSVIGYIHLVMIGFFTLFFLWIFIDRTLLKQSILVNAGLFLLIIGVIFSELLMFVQALLIYQWHITIPDYTNLLLGTSLLMPLGITSIVLSKIFDKKKA